MQIKIKKLSDAGWDLYSMQIKTKKLSPTAILPTKTHQTDAGWDLYSDVETVLWPKERLLITTNIAFQIPAGYVGLIWPRSGLSYKKGIDILGGVIDHGFSDSVGVIMYNTGDEKLEITRGDRIAQILFQEVPHFNLVEVSELDESDRGTKGYGSSGLK